MLFSPKILSQLSSSQFRKLILIFFILLPTDLLRCPFFSINYFKTSSIKVYFHSLNKENSLCPFNRKKRNPTEALLKLQSEINMTTLYQSSLFSNFLSLGTLSVKFCRQENVPCIHLEFFQHRNVSVWVQNTISSLIAENGVSRDETLSVLIFLVAINDITKCVKFSLRQSPFADSSNISFRSSNPLQNPPTPEGKTQLHLLMDFTWRFSLLFP